MEINLQKDDLHTTVKSMEKKMAHWVENLCKNPWDTLGNENVKYK